MPMKHDPAGGGTNADGTKSEDYCSYCYQNGEFTFKGTLEEMQEFCRKKNDRTWPQQIFSLAANAQF